MTREAFDGPAVPDAIRRERPTDSARPRDRTTMRIEIDDVTRPQVLALLEEHLREMHTLSPPEHVFAFDAGRLRAPGVALWTAWDGDTLLGCIALKELSSTQGELKSMRTASHARRTGAGRALLAHTIAVARDRGYRELLLETGRHPAFGPAQTLYRSAGFRACGPFSDYVENGNSVFMVLHLARDEDFPREATNRDAKLDS